MGIRIQLLSIFVSFLLLWIIIRFILKGKLREEYAVIWVILCLSMLFFAFWRSGIDFIARKVGVYYAPSLLFIVAIFLIMAYLLHLSIVNTKQEGKIKRLAQEIAFLRSELGNKQADRKTQNLTNSPDHEKA